MALIEWRDEFSTGDPAVDHEHRELVELINELHGKLSSGDHSTEAVENFLGEIYLKITAHFALEERMMREAGAAEVHFRSACPPIKFPDFYGIDMAGRNELIAANMELDEMTAKLEAESLAFLSVNGLYQAVVGEDRNDADPQLADHYFTGEYPTRLVDHDRDLSAKEFQLSLLVDA